MEILNWIMDNPTGPGIIMVSIFIVAGCLFEHHADELEVRFRNWIQNKLSPNHN